MNMALPKIMYPQFDINIPSLKTKQKFRQFLVKEEKILLVAKTSAEDNDILAAIKQVVQNCSIDDNFNVDKIAVFDLEYIFLKLRAISVGNIIKLSYKDFEDEKIYDLEVNLDEIDIEIPKEISNKISIFDKNGIVMRYAPASIYSDTKFLSSSTEEATIELIVRCIDKIYDENSVYDSKNFTREELLEYVNNIDLKAFEKINDFLNSAPKLKHTINYKNSLGNDRKIELSSLNDFFMLR
jgi:hypothetical protein